MTGHEPQPGATGFGPDDEVCLCFRVPLRKISAYLEREDPPVASLISECLGAGTGCGWCVPVLRELHAQHARGEALRVELDPAAYARGRAVHRASRDEAEKEAEKKATRRHE